MNRLASNVRVDVRYRDETALGAADSDRLQNNMKRLFRPIHRALDRHGPKYVVTNGAQLIHRCFSAPRFKNLFGCEHPRIKKELMYPSPARIVPDGLIFTSSDTGRAINMEMPRDHWHTAADWLAHLSAGSAYDNRRNFSKIETELSNAGMLVEANFRLTNRKDADVLFVGHNTVAVKSPKSRVVIDPWFFPTSVRYAKRQQPLQSHNLGRISAVLITHSHPDHFDPGSLLRIGRSTPVIVPVTSAESLLSVDMKKRLRELGFNKVTDLAWWQTTIVEDMKITALPFHGEQPTSTKRLYPEIRNCGNCYRIETPDFSCAFIADSGKDADGDVYHVALEAFERFGPIDILFSGYRGWNLYPIQFFESSVRQYLLFVPPELYEVRQTIMNTVEDAVNTAEMWHAKYLAPYGDGGAPWYAELGLGPQILPEKSSSRRVWESFDPLPQRCLSALSARTEPIPGITVGSPVAALILRPGQGFRIQEGRIC
jgi:L-ascorbate metabolism protein UlaG (beta-lactamase superfamily)